jgi:hypothetical protein
MRVALVLLAACTSSAGGVTGQTPGGSFEPAVTLSAAVTVPDGAGGSSGEALIVLSTAASVCSDATAMPPISRKGSRSMVITLLDVNGGTTAAPTAPGSYTIYSNSGSQPPKEALFDMVGLDSGCQQVDADGAQGQSGTVTLTSITGGVFKGSFDVVLNTGDHVTGTFDPTACAGLQQVAAPTQQAVCN